MGQARELRPLALICEGTDAEDGTRITEHEVHGNALRAVQRAGLLVVADFGPRNVERLLTFLDIARQTGRKLLVLAKDAYLLKIVRTVSPPILITVHTEKPQYFVIALRGKGVEMRVPEMGGETALVS